MLFESQHSPLALRPGRVDLFSRFRVDLRNSTPISVILRGNPASDHVVAVDIEAYCCTSSSRLRVEFTFFSFFDQNERYDTCVVHSKKVTCASDPMIRNIGSVGSLTAFIRDSARLSSYLAASSTSNPYPKSASY